LLVSKTAPQKKQSVPTIAPADETPASDAEASDASDDEDDDDDEEEDGDTEKGSSLEKSNAKPLSSVAMGRGHTGKQKKLKKGGQSKKKKKGKKGDKSEEKQAESLNSKVIRRIYLLAVLLLFINLVFAFFVCFCLWVQMLSALLTGVNRAFPFAPVNDAVYDEQADTLFKIVHTGSFAARVQALMLLYQVSILCVAAGSKNTNNFLHHSGDVISQCGV
jgi:hypothetical protein